VKDLNPPFIEVTGPTVKKRYTVYSVCHFRRENCSRMVAPIY